MPRKKLIDEEKLEQKAQEEFNEGIEKAQVILEDEDKVEKLLEKLEKQIKLGNITNVHRNTLI